ncbi:hypothetical protein GOV07_01495 [Candidatus Woesearchaeota archaeon]|nr:hypothetical protein [Candidatus Woesearchaeota archaeon]
MNRKGIVYLFAAVMLISVFFTIMYSTRLPTTRDRAESERMRIVTMADFIKDFYSDVHRATHIAGFRSFIAVEQHISQTGQFVTNSSPVFIEAFMNGSVDGTFFEIMENSTFGEYLERVNVEAGAIGILLNVSVDEVWLDQSTPWSVDISFNMTMNVTDVRGVARWDVVKEFTTEVSILDIRDPAYTVYTFGKVPNTIRKSPYNNSEMVDGDNDSSVLNDELVNMYYREDPYAPNFLQRLEGNLTGSSKYGIASLVDLDELDAQGIYIRTYLSVIDFNYFTNASTTNYCPDFGKPLPEDENNWFKIDAQHHSDSEHNFELDDLNATVC